MDVESRTVPSGIKFLTALLVKCDAEPVFKKSAAAMPPKLLYKPEFLLHILVKMSVSLATIAVPAPDKAMLRKELVT